MPPSSTTSVAWTSTFPLCVNLVSTPPYLFYFLLLVSLSARTRPSSFLSHIRRASRTLRVRTYEEV
jgi:hypothetical protein